MMQISTSAKRTTEAAHGRGESALTIRAAFSAVGLMEVDAEAEVAEGGVDESANIC